MASKANQEATIGDRLKELRIALGMTQRVISDVSGIPLGSWKKYESGEQIPGGEAIASLAVTGANLHRLLTGIGPILIKDLYSGDQLATSITLMAIEDVVETAEEVLQGRGLQLSPRRKARMIRAAVDVYERLNKNSKADESGERFRDLIIDLLNAMTGNPGD